jgi:Fe-S cluster assembly ATP-binding protein
MNTLELKNFKVSIDNKEIVKGINLELKSGEITVIMGPNGSGKSTLANGLMGHPKMKTTGIALLNKKNILEMSPDERSKNGLFLSFQYPSEISGVTVSNFLRTAMNARRPKENPIKVQDYVKIFNEKMKMLDINKQMASRYLNEGFSGGEKKKMEILQMAMLEPKVAILDETDSGLDIDALKAVCESINTVRKENKNISILIITHYERMLQYLKPNQVCIMLDGKIVKKGGAELARELEEKGYKVHK